MLQKTIYIKKVIPPKQSLFQAEIDLLVSQVNEATGRKNKPSLETVSKRLQAANILIQGLYRCHVSFSSGIALAVPHHSSFYKLGDENKIHDIGFKIVISVVETMMKLGWIKRRLGYRTSADAGETTILLATGDLSKKFEKIGLVWEEIETIPDVLVLRNYDANTKKKYRQNVPDSDLFRRMAANLRRINKYLVKQAICVFVSNNSYQRLGNEMTFGQKNTLYDFNHQGKYPRYLDFTMVQLRRIFSRNNMKLGGRFYGGWWQFIPKKYRVHITINSQPTIEIDYSGLHPCMMYHLEGLKPPAGDMYDIGVWSCPEEMEVKRPIIKEFFNAIVNDEYGEYKMPKSSRKIIGLSNKQLRAKIAQKHPQIAHNFNSGYGLTLQYEDSMIAERVMLLLLKQDITCLPVHDSFIVQVFHEKELVHAMNQAYFERFSESIKRKSKFLYNRGPDGSRLYSIEFPLLFQVNGEVDKLALYKMHEESIHNRYVNSRRSTSSK